MSNLELNKGDNIIFAIDVSASMGNSDCVGGLSRIEYAKEKTIAFINESAKHDTDGVDIITFGHKVEALTTSSDNFTSTAEIVKQLKATEGATDTAGAIRKAWSLSNSKQQTVLFVITDGEPSDAEAVKSVIQDISNNVTHEHQFNISLLTVGEVSLPLRNFLAELDDDLQGSKYDIVDVKTLDEVDFIGAFASALQD
jgi:Mg-chelatase subunit ChlD